MCKILFLTNAAISFYLPTKSQILAILATRFLHVRKILTCIGLQGKEINKSRNHGYLIIEKIRNF